MAGDVVAVREVESWSHHVVCGVGSVGGFRVPALATVAVVVVIRVMVGRCWIVVAVVGPNGGKNRHLGLVS